MPPKSAKSQKKKGKETKVLEYAYGSWTNDVKHIEVNDKDWTCFIAFLAPRELMYIGMIDDMNQSVLKGKRIHVKTISRRTIVEAIQTNCGKTGIISPYSALCDEIKKCVGIYFEGQIPSDLAACLIKYILLDIKQKDILRRKKEKQLRDDKAKLLEELKVHEDKQKTGKKSEKGKKKDAKKTAKKQDKEKGKETTKGKKGKAAKDDSLGKVDTRLNKRSEDPIVPYPVEDQPLSSPTVYIIIADLDSVNIVRDLLEIGVPLNMVIDIGFQNDEEKQIPVDVSEMLSDYTYGVLSSVRLNQRKKVMSMTVLGNKEQLINEFWSSFIDDYWGSETCSLYDKVVLSEYNPLFLTRFKYVPKTAGETMLEELCKIMYDYTNMCEIYQHFISDNTIVEIPRQLHIEVEDMMWYQKVINEVEPETVDVPFVLDTLVAQVCLIDEEEYGYDLSNYIPELEEEGGEEEIRDEKRNCVEEKIKSLNLDHELFVIEVVNQKHEEIIKPMVLPYGDVLFTKTYQSGEKKRLVRDRSEHVLKCYIAGLVWSVLPSIELLEKDLYEMHFNLLKDSIPLRDRVKVAEMLVSLRQLDVLNEGKTEIPRETVLQLKNNAISLEFTPDIKKASVGVLTHIPRCSYVKCKDVTELLDTIGNKGALINNVNFFENMGPIILSQQLLISELNCSRTEKLYSSLTDAMVFRFEENSFCVNWDAFLPTIVSLRDFIQFETSMYPNWTKWWMDQLNEIEPEPEDLFRFVKEFPIGDPITPISLDDKVNIDSFEWTMPGSLEYSKILGHPLQEQEMIIFHRNHSERSPRSSYEFNEEINTIETIVLYNMDDHRRKYFSGTNYYYRMDNDLSLRFNFFTPLYETEKLGVFIKKYNATFNYHTKLLSSADEPRLNVLLDSGLVILFFEETTTIGEPINDVESTDELGEWEVERFETKQDFEYTILETSFNLKMSLPNGFRLETVRFGETLLIKQQYDIAEPFEKCRYTLKDGQVIRFLTDDAIEILHPCGKIITIYDFVTEQTEVNLGSGDSPGEFKEPRVHYRQIHSHGKVERIINGLVLEEEGLFTRESYDPFRNEHLTERADGTEILILANSDRIVFFPDGTRIKSKVHVTSEDFLLDWDEYDLEEWFTDEQSVASSVKILPSQSRSLQSASFKWLPSDLGIYSPLGSVASIELGSWANVAEQNAEREKPRKKTKIYTYGDGFVVYDLSFEIEHPKFARLSVCPTDAGTRIEMLRDVSGFIFDDGTYSMKFGETTNVKVTKDKFIIFGIEDDRMTDETMILFHAFRSEGTLPQFSVPIVWSRHSNREEVILNTKSDVRVRRKMRPEDTDGYRYFYVRRDLTGFEMLHNDEYNRYKEEFCKETDAILQQYDNVPFVDHLILRPFKPPQEKWDMPVHPIEETALYELPSTYGNEWPFPFKEKEKILSKAPQLLEVRLLQRLVCYNHHEKFQEILRNYMERANMMVQGVGLPSPCECVKPPTSWSMLAGIRGETDFGQLLYTQGQIILRNPGPEFMKYLKKYFLFGSAKRALYEDKKERLFEDFKIHKAAYSNRKIPNYFKSCFNIAREEMSEILHTVEDAVDTKRYELECLLGKRLDELSDKEVCDMIYLLKTVPHPYWSTLPGSGFSVEDVIEAGLQLKDKFSTMKEVLLFHGKCHEKASGEIIENILDHMFEYDNDFADEDDGDFEGDECEVEEEEEKICDEL